MKTKLCTALCAMVFCAPAAHAGLFGPNDYASCMLDRLPSAPTQVAAIAIRQDCERRFPDHPRYRTTFASMQDFYASASPRANTCTIEYTRSVTNPIVASMIAYACNEIYQ